MIWLFFFFLYRHIEYGAIFLCWFMHFPFIVITDPEMVKVLVEQMWHIINLYSQ